MEFRKSNIIYLLYLSSFSFFAIGKYITQVGNFSVGQLISVFPLLIILLFFFTDVLLRRNFHPQLKSPYLFALAFNIVCIWSMYEGVRNGFPGFNNISLTVLAIVITTIIHAPLILQFYHSKNPTFSIVDLLYWGMTIEIILNLMGYAVGWRNAVHSIEGRLNLPFGQGLYSNANTVAILNLIILGKWLYGKDERPGRFFLVIHFLVNLVLMVGFNSRLSIMIFFLIAGLMVIRALFFHRILYFISFFTITLLLNFAELIYLVLSQPVFSSILKRVDYDDITRFNGRRDLWERGMDWLLTQGQGFLFGNGYHGYYYIGLNDDLEDIWGKSAINIHMHSSFLEFVTTIGVVGILPLFILFFVCLAYMRRKNLEGHRDGILFGVAFYLLFLFQIDNFVYITNYGSFLFFIIVAPSLIVKQTNKRTEQIYESEIKDIDRYAVV